MSNLLKIFAFVAGVAAVCAIVCWTMFHFAVPDDGHAEVGHEWLHEELGLNADEIAIIEGIEEDYEAKRKELERSFADKQRELANLLKEEKSYSDVVKEAVRGLHHIHGNLQALSIEHYYDMLETLPADKQQRLRDLAAKALSKPE